LKSVPQIASTDRSVSVSGIGAAANGARRELDVDPGIVGGPRIDRAVEPAATVDLVVAAEAFEIFGSSSRVGAGR